jgi:hypothetical protein
MGGQYQYFLFILLPLKENSFAEKYLLISLQVT